MGQIAEYLQSAIKQITDNVYRTFMTMLGIIIGIAAVIAVIALGNGMTDYIKTQFDTLYGESGYISIDVKKTNERMTAEDLKEVKMTLPDIKGITPTFYPSYDGKIKTEKGIFLASVAARNEGGYYAGDTEMAEGKYFTEQQVDTSQRLMVMKDTDALKIFGTTECVGRVVELSLGAKSAEYTICGLRKNNSKLLDMLDAAEDMEFYASVEIPYTSYGADYDIDTSKMDAVDLYASPDILKERTKQAGDIIGQNHGIRGTEAISARYFEGAGDIFASTLKIAQNFLMLVAAISLLVGGIGVMNIMLVSVTERTREIGIRKSIGARTEAIMIQFLAESAMLTLMGGILGILVGIGIAFAICKALTFRLIIEPSSILFATVFSVGIGIFFGIYPARKAAKMKPIDALRT